MAEIAFGTTVHLRLGMALQESGRVAFFQGSWGKVQESGFVMEKGSGYVGDNSFNSLHNMLQIYKDEFHRRLDQIRKGHSNSIIVFARSSPGR